MVAGRPHQRCGRDHLRQARIAGIPRRGGATNRTAPGGRPQHRRAYPEGGINGPRLQPAFRYGAFGVSLQTGIQIVPVYLHYEALHDFHWGRHSLIQNMRNIMNAGNNRANYYLFDAIDPRLFHDKIEYCNHVYRLYEEWQRRYLG